VEDFQHLEVLVVHQEVVLVHLEEAHLVVEAREAKMEESIGYAFNEDYKKGFLLGALLALISETISLIIFSWFRQITTGIMILLIPVLIILWFILYKIKG
jgi:hypothetical protein